MNHDKEKVVSFDIWVFSSFSFFLQSKICQRQLTHDLITAFLTLLCFKYILFWFVAGCYVIFGFYLVQGNEDNHVVTACYVIFGFYLVQGNEDNHVVTACYVIFGFYLVQGNEDNHFVTACYVIFGFYLVQGNEDNHVVTACYVIFGFYLVQGNEDNYKLLQLVTLSLVSIWFKVMKITTFT